MALYKQFNSQRQFYIDWLRIFAIFIVFVFHCARIFDIDEYHVQNSQMDAGLTVFTAFVRGWIMPLFFILSGMATYYSLNTRKNWHFIKERTLRLIVPFFFGIFILVPIIVYYDRLNHLLFSGSYFEFYPNYFKEIFIYLSNFQIPAAHLWFLIVLFFFSIASVLPFRYIIQNKNSDKFPKLFELFQKPGIIFILFIPIALTEIFTPWIPYSYLFAFGGMQITTYFIIFIFGFLFAYYPRNIQILKKNVPYAFIFGIFTSIMLILRKFFYFDYVLFSIILSLNIICWLLIIIYLGHKFLCFEHKKLKLINEILLPFFILHQIVIVMIGFYVIQINTIVFLKFFLIASISFPIIVSLVLIIRRVKVCRFLFGLKLKKGRPIKQD